MRCVKMPLLICVYFGFDDALEEVVCYMTFLKPAQN